MSQIISLLRQGRSKMILYYYHINIPTIYFNMKILYPRRVDYNIMYIVQPRFISYPWFRQTQTILRRVLYNVIMYIKVQIHKYNIYIYICTYTSYMCKYRHYSCSTVRKILDLLISLRSVFVPLALVFTSYNIGEPF